MQLHYGFIIVLLHAKTQLQTAATPRFLNFYTHFCSFYHLDISSFHYPLIWQSVTLAHSICALPETCPHFCLGNPHGCWGYQNWGLGSIAWKSCRPDNLVKGSSGIVFDHFKDAISSVKSTILRPARPVKKCALRAWKHLHGGSPPFSVVGFWPQKTLLGVCVTRCHII